MAFRVCCSCKTPGCFGFWLRHGKITSATLADTGLESQAWSHVTTGGADYYQISDSGSPWAEQTQVLCYGIRYETYMPAFNEDLWPQFTTSHESVWPSVTKIDTNIGITYCDRFEQPTDTEVVPYFHQCLSMLNTSAATASSVSTKAIQGIVIPFTESNWITNPSLPNIGIRPRYYRILDNGTPITGVLDAISDTDYEWLYPRTDATKTNWTGVGSTTNLWANVNENTPTDNSYNYSANNLITTLQHVLSASPAVATNYGNDFQLTYRIARSHFGTILGSSDPGNPLNVTVSLLHGGTSIWSETRTVPADWTTYTTAIPWSAGKLIGTSELRVQFVTTASGGPSDDARGCAISAVNLRYTNWNRWVRSDMNAKSSPATFVSTAAINRPRYWAFSNSVSKWIFKKNVVFGIDVWFEIFKRTTSAFTLRTGYLAGTNIEPTPVGPIGVKAGFNDGFDPERFTYKLTFNGGKVRPDSSLNDEVYFSEQQGGANENHYLKSTHAVSSYSGSTEYFGSRVAFCWQAEIPSIVLTSVLQADVNAVYVPELTTGQAVNRLKRQTATGFSYGYLQNVAGYWNPSGSTTFVKVFNLAVNTTGMFTDQTAYNDYPETITVERVPLQKWRYSYVDTTATNVTRTGFWLVPDGVQEIIAEVWGGGGGSGGIKTGIPAGLRSHGGGGAYSRSTLSVTPGSSISYQIGAGGASGTDDPTTATNGGNGVDTWLVSSSTLMAKGGTGATAALVGGSPGTPGTGGQASAGFGDVKYSGGNGASNYGAFPLVLQGGGSAGQEDANGVDNYSYLASGGTGNNVKRGNIFGVGSKDVPASQNGQRGGIIIRWIDP